MKDSKSGQLRPLKNSSFKWPKTCSVAPLSRQFPLRDMLWVTSAFFRRRVHFSCWYCQPMSECNTGFAPSGILSSRRSSRSSCCSMSGLVEVDQATISLLPKSYTGAKYALPQGCLNSVTSVPIFCHGPSAEKSRPMTFSKVSPTAPLYELYLW